ncbi:MAG: creatininase [Gammaproteobacteria bacterium]|nr:creatininase [Gammaproteobacteria bacterium]
MTARDWWDLTTRDFAEMDFSNTVALLPVAAVEQHGPHLPVRVDAAINAGIVDAARSLLPDELNLLILPAQNVGKSDEHNAFPGTLSISYETLVRLWFDLAESVHRAGCRRIIMFNSHGGQPQLIDILCRDLRVRLGMFAVNCSWFNLVDMNDLFDATELRHGIHGGAVETSIMLHLHPSLVKLSEARNFPSTAEIIERENRILRAEGAVGFGWQTQDLNPHGVCGDAGKADASLGAVLVGRAAQALATLVGEVARFPLARIAD